MKIMTPLVLAIFLLSAARVAGAQDDGSAPQAADDVWLESLMTETPQEGFALAVVLARRGVATTQTDRNVLRTGRPAYANDPDSLIAASQVIAIHFQTIAAANGYWRGSE